MSLELPELTQPIYEPAPQKKPTWVFTGAQERPAEQGWQWLKSAFQLFRIEPLPWLFRFIGSFGLILTVALIPGIGQWSGVLVYPVLGWWMWTISKYHDKQSSAANKRHPDLQSSAPALILLGALSMVASLLLSYVVEDLTGISLDNMTEPQEGQTPDLEVLIPLLKAMLLHTLLSLPITMATYFAPPLIALQGVALSDSMRLSFLACIKNILPLGWNFTIVLAIAGASMIFGGLPLLIFAPVFLLMLYTSYLDIFLKLEFPEEQPPTSPELDES